MENIKDLPPMERPREKLQLQGPAILKDSELLAILLGSGNKGLPVSAICNNLLQNYSLQELVKIDGDSLRRVKGVGEAKAMILLAAFELSRRLHQTPRTIIKDDRAVFNLLQPIFKKLNELQYILVLMTAEKELLAIAEAGSLLPEIPWSTGLALKAGAKCMLLARNGWL